MIQARILIIIETYTESGYKNIPNQSIARIIKQIENYYI